MEDNVLGQIFDFGRGIFKDFIDFERGDVELELIRSARANEAALLNRQAPVTTGGGFGLQLQSLLPWLAVGLVAVLVLPKLLK